MKVVFLNLLKEVKQQSTPAFLEEYIRFALQSEKRHEYVNGKWIEMPGERGINNKIAGSVYAFLLLSSKPKGFCIYISDIKVATPEKTDYYHLYVFMTCKPKTKENKYVR